VAHTALATISTPATKTASIARRRSRYARLWGKGRTTSRRPTVSATATRSARPAPESRS
jgi:hypothetical protein